MVRIIASLLLCVIAQPIFAQTCPPKYRFVDFGLEGPDGVVRRGGTIFRAFDTEGTPLLAPAGTACRSVPEMSIDGRGLRIPVVTEIEVNLDVARIDVLALRLSALDDPVAAAEDNAARHRDRLAQPGATHTRGETFLCANMGGSDAVSCQLVSPYDNNAALVVYCQAEMCEMPVMVRDEQLVIRANWRRSAEEAEALATEISRHIQTIQGFLKAQM